VLWYQLLAASCRHVDGARDGMTSDREVIAQCRTASGPPTPGLHPRSCSAIPMSATTTDPD